MHFAISFIVLRTASVSKHVGSECNGERISGCGEWHAAITEAQKVLCCQQTGGVDGLDELVRPPCAITPDDIKRRRTLPELRQREPRTSCAVVRALSVGI